jgi:hypothetical protein
MIIRIKLLNVDKINDRSFIDKELKLAFDKINYLKSELKQKLSYIELPMKSEKDCYKIRLN